MAVVQDLCERTVIINNGKIITDDKIANLLRLFEVRSYTITCGEMLSNQQLQSIKKKFPQHKYMPDTHQAILEIDLAKSEEIYDLFDVLKKEHTLVESIDRRSEERPC